MAAPTSTAPTVCVTGASGFIASWLVKQLLERGYRVKGTVRSLSNPKKTEHLRQLPGADERLQLVEADLMSEGSFDDAVAGCTLVFHTASPFFYENVTDPEAQLLSPAVNGTLNVLQSCTKHTSIKRVVLTSSTAAVVYDPSKPADALFDESCWSDADSCRENKMWYVLSKTLAEKAAWDFAKQRGIDLVSINPALVVGDLLQPELNTSSQSVLRYINGTNTTYGNGTMGYVHVEDVALAHILAAEQPTANGRYLLVERWVHYKETCETLHKLVPNAPVPTKCADGGPLAQPRRISNQRARELGINFKSLEDMLRDSIKGLQEKGFIELP